jgi:hypothetical protein
MVTSLIVQLQLIQIAIAHAVHHVMPQHVILGAIVNQFQLVLAVNYEWGSNAPFDLNSLGGKNVK